MELTNIQALVRELAQLPSETGWVEFKHNNCDPKMIGEDISALANSAVLAERACAYMVWGLSDDNHSIVGTKVRLSQEKKGNQELENWLRFLLSPNADFSFQSCEIDGMHIEVLVISKAVNVPVTFEKTAYIRVGSYTKKIQEFQTLQSQLWEKLRREQFENVLAITDITLQRCLQLLDVDSYFNILHLPLPSDIDGYVHYLIQENIIIRQDNGLFSITNLGALLFAKRLSDFNRLERKAIRVVQYQGKNRMTILKEETFLGGYASSLEAAVKYTIALLPSKEDINQIRLTTESAYPLPAIRESIANSLIHQDLYITGAGPVVEIFENRIEITNPGTPMVDVMRIVDNPPKSRNERLASLMRRLKMCEELGRGWDRMVISCEVQKLPAPQITIYSEATRVTVYSNMDFSNIQLEDKVWSAYLHACLKHISGDALTNTSLRERFGLQESGAANISRLIKEAVAQKLIKPLDPTTAKRYMKYLPWWA